MCGSREPCPPAQRTRSRGGPPPPRHLLQVDGTAGLLREPKGRGPRRMGRRGAVPSDYLSGLVAAHEQVAHAMERIVLPPAVVRSFRLNAFAPGRPCGAHHVVGVGHPEGVGEVRPQARAAGVSRPEWSMLRPAGSAPATEEGACYDPER